MKYFDAVIIGTGQSGPPLAMRLADAGWNVAIAERNSFGGTCVNTGCTPTKTMIASARVAYLVRRAAEYGIDAGVSVHVDMKRVIERVDAVVTPSRTGWEERLNEKCTVFAGHATFESDNYISVNSETLQGEHVFIDVGARPVIPEDIGLDEVPYLTNSDMVALERLPEHLIVLGGSYLGLEFAQMFNRFGSAVTVIESGPRLIQHEDEDVSAAVAAMLQEEGIHVFCDASALFSESQGKVEASIETPEGHRRIAASDLLVATGRRPNTDDLGLENTGIETDERGHIVVDDNLRTSIEGIWALGDCNGRGAFTHTSYDDYEIVAANLLDGRSIDVTHRIPAYAMYTDPPLARIGMSESEARKSGRRILKAEMPMSGVSRAREMGETHGFMKILVDADSDEILGAALLGVHCDEAVHCLLDTMYCGGKSETIRQAVHIHPTVSELIPTMLGRLRPLE